MFRSYRLALLLAIASAATASFAASGDRDALWKIMHDQCVPDEQARNNPAPCARVDLKGGIEKGYVIMKDRVGVGQFLLTSTALSPMFALRSPRVLARSAPPGPSFISSFMGGIFSHAGWRRWILQLTTRSSFWPAAWRARHNTWAKKR